MNRMYSCFFTGHRFIPREHSAIMHSLLNKKIRELVEFRGVEDFICGGALGFDTYAAEAVLSRKRLFPHIRLHLYLPCYGQSDRWSSYNQNVWKAILQSADSYTYVSESDYFNGCMQLRNEKMANDAIYCLAYYTNENSGTGATLRYAQNQGCIIENLAEFI